MKTFCCPLNFLGISACLEGPRSPYLAHARRSNLRQRTELHWTANRLAYLGMPVGDKSLKAPNNSLSCCSQQTEKAKPSPPYLIQFGSNQVAEIFYQLSLI